jgi:hypothetical protein
MAVARGHSTDMAQNWFFGHVSPTTGALANRLRRYNMSYRTASQNIAYAASPRGAHATLMRDSSNRANVLNREYTHVGVGVVRVGGRLMVTETFVGAHMHRAGYAPARRVSTWSPWGAARRVVMPSPWSVRSSAQPQPQATTPAEPTRSPSRFEQWRARRAAERQQADQCAIEGTWQGRVPNGLLRGRTVTFVFRNNNTATGSSGSITTNTSWTRQGNTLAIRDISATPSMAACPSSQTGQYNITFGSDCQSVRVVSGSDFCRHRNLTLQGLQASRVR